jgi:succinoglycan biosynthesis transport protein ExoP
MEEQLDFLSLVKLTLKHKIAIIVSIVACIILAAVINAYMVPVYQASSEVLLSSQAQKTLGGQQVDETYQVLLLSEQLAKTFTQMISSRALADQVIKRNKLAMSPEELQEKVRAILIEETQLIQITVTDTNAKRAAILANEYSTAFAIMVKRSMPASAPINISIIDPATTPSDPVKPRPTLNLMLGFLLGILIAIGLVFVLEKLDNTVKEPEQVEQLLKIISLARVPNTEHPLLLDNDSMQGSDAFRSLRTNLQYLNFNQSIKTIAVTSANMGDGKTTVSVNLATVYAKAGNKVLIVDCDLRRPMIGKTLNSNGRGLSELLVGKSNLKSVISRTRIEGLYVISSGLIPPNPADLLGSDRLTDLLSELKEEFDVVILDCPPVLGVADTVILASKADAILLVTHAGKTKKQEIALAKDTLKKVGAHILGFVINGVRMDKNNYYYHDDYDKHRNKRRAVGDGTRS